MSAEKTPEVTLESLMDPAQAHEIYDVSWSDGMGSSTMIKALDEVMKPVPYLRFSHAHKLSKDRKASVTVLRVAIPRGASPESVAEAAAVAEGILRAQQSILPHADLDVFEDTLASEGFYTVKPLEQGYAITRTTWGVTKTLAETETLLEALQSFEKLNITYGAVEA